MNVDIISSTEPRIGHGTTDELIEYAGRVCFNSLDRFAEDTQRFVRRRIDEAHLGLLEHVSFTFAINGISRSTANQLVRHRIASYAQESQRYVRQTEEYVTPKTISSDELLDAIYHNTVSAAFHAYYGLLKAGVPKEDARYVLPVGTKTNIVVTMNARSLLHFFDMRLAKGAQSEIRVMAFKMLGLLAEESTVFNDYYSCLGNLYNLRKEEELYDEK